MRIGNLVFGKRAKGSTSFGPDAGWNTFPLQNLSTLFTTRDMTAENLTAMYYRKSGLMLAALGVRAQCLSSLRWKHLDDNGEEIEESPFVKLLKNPNPAMDSTQFLTASEIFGCHGGDMYEHMVRDRYEGIIQVYPYHIGNIYPVSKPLEWINRYEFSNGTTKVPIPVSDIIRIGWHSVNLQFPFRSISPMASLAEELDMDLQRIGMGNSQLKNGGMPAFFLELSDQNLVDENGMPIKLTEEFLDRLGQKISERFSVGKNRGRAAVITNGTKPHFPPRNAPLDLNDYAILAETRTTAVFGVSGMILGLYSSKDTKQYNSFTEAVKSLYRETILPRAEMYQSGFTEFFRGRGGVPESVGGVPFAGSLVLDHSHLEAIQSTILDKTEVANTQFTGGMITLNESRASFNYPPDPDPNKGNKYLWELTGTSNADTTGVSTEAA